jgi:hypothetical protein
VLAADHRITAWARQLKRAGLDGDMDQLRARAFLDLLTGTDSRPTGQAATDDHAATARQDSTTGQPGPAHPADLTPAGFATRGTLTIPLATLLGLADRPGQLAGTPIDPWLARDLAHAAATSPTTTWCVTATSHHGHATWHACARPAPASHTRHGRRGKRGGPGPPGPAGNRDQPGPGLAFTRDGRDGPPGSPGTWTLTIHGRQFLVEFHPPSPPRTATTGARPKATTPALSSGT